METFTQLENINRTGVNRGKITNLTGISNKSSALSDVKNTLDFSKNVLLQRKSCQMYTPKIEATPSVPHSMLTPFIVYKEDEHDHSKCEMIVKEENNVAELRLSLDVLERFSNIGNFLNPTLSILPEINVYPDIQLNCIAVLAPLCLDDLECFEDLKLCIPPLDDIY